MFSVFLPGGVPYYFLLPELADHNKPFVSEKMTNMADQLVALDEEQASSAWSAFFFNVDATVSLIRSTPPEQVKVVLGTGAQWSGSG